MTSSARDARYGRRGGRWAETRQGDGICDTCRNGDARHIAHHTGTGETWHVCESCRKQAVRLGTPITHEPLLREATP